MHLTLLLPALLSLASAASDNAKAFILDKHISSGGAATISSPQARLVLAQRLNVAQYHDIHEATDNTLQLINTYGGHQHALFEADTSAPGRQLVIIAEGCDKDTSLLGEDSHIKEAFDITNPASEKHNSQFVQDLIQQAGHDSPAASAIIHVDMAKASDILTVNELVSKYYTHDDVSSILLIAMPESSRNSKHHLYPYGPYEMPTTHHERRGLEDPLIAFPDTKPTFKQATGAQYSPAASNNTSPLKLPALCYPSKDACESTTNACSGHGSCYKRYSSSESDCFACRCEPTFHKGKDGKSKTIYYGGNACQKRDISSQFWLIATFSIVLVGLISWAIGMMFSIGEEKLPGVIGAGVSGPKAGRTGM